MIIVSRPSCAFFLPAEPQDNLAIAVVQTRRKAMNGRGKNRNTGLLNAFLTLSLCENGRVGVRESR